MTQSLVGKYALVVGGTNGIGQGFCVWLAQQGSSVTVAGRSRERGQAVVEELKAVSKDIHPPPTFEFLPVDLFSIADTERFTQEYQQKHDKLDFLVLTAGIASLQRNETPEGLDEKLSVHYYGRVSTILGLLPLLEKNAAEGRDVRVLSVLSAGIHSPYTQYRQDPDLKVNYSIKNAADVAGFYNDLALDSLAREHPNITFAHAAPGFVNTAWGSNFNWFLKGAVRGLQALFAKSPLACAQTIGSPSLLSPNFKGGFRLFSPNGTVANKTTIHDEAREFVWNHTISLLEKLKAAKPQTTNQ